MAILDTIDTKLEVENDMKEMLYEMRSVRESMDAELESMNNRITILYWLVGALGLLTIILEIMK